MAPSVRLVAAGSVLIAVTYGLARFALGLFVPEIRASLALSATAAGLVVGASFAGYLVALGLAGRLVARHGPRAVALTAGAAATVGMGGVAAASDWRVLALAAAVGGTSTGLASPALAAAVEAHLAPRARPLGQTVVNAGTSLGLMAAVPMAAVAGTSWRRAWLGFAVAALVLTLSLARALPADAPGIRPGVAVRPALPSGRLAASAVLLGLGSAAFWGFAREALEGLSGLAATTSRLAWVAVGLVGLAGAWAGTAVRRLGLATSLALAGAMLAASLATLAVGPATPALALAAAGAFGAGYMGMTGLLIVWSVQEQPANAAGAVATAFLLLAVGQVVGSVGAGVLADVSGLRVAFLAATMAVAGTALVVPRARRRPASETTGLRT